MKKIDKIAYGIILIVIVILNICIGSNIKNPIWIIQAIVSVFTVFYIIIKKIGKEKNIVIKGKIDIAVLVLMISTILPFIFKTYASLEGTVNFILKYWSYFSLYILVRNVIVEQRQIKTVINTLIISSVVPIIFGYDKLLGFNIFESFLENINAVKIEDTRMISTFGYANTFAVYLALIGSLSIGRVLTEKNKIRKILYVFYLIIVLVTIALTQSKAVIALIAVTCLVFIIKGIKDKKITKKCIIAGIVCVLMFFIYFFIAINISKPLEITEEEKTCVIRGIEKNKKYTFEFDIEAISNKEYNSFEISIVEITRYFSEKTLGRISFSAYKGKKQIEVETDEFVSHIEIRITNKLNQKITIKSCNINNEPYILEYKIIPDEIVRIFTTFNFKNTSVFQRFDYWRDGIDIIKDNWLIGAGGNAWRMLYGQNQDYLYYAKEGHSYILEVWMSFGILGILSYIFIISITLKNSIDLLKKLKENNKELYIINLSIIIGIFLIIIHSIMDFDMSYLIIQMILYIFIAILNKDDKQIHFKSNIVDYIVLLFVIIVSLGNVLGLISKHIETEDGRISKKIAPWISRYKYNEIVYLENNNLEENKIDHIKKYIKDEPYNYQNIMYEIMSNAIIENLTYYNIEKNIEDIKFLKEVLKNIKQERRYDVSQIQQRANIIVNFSEKLIDKSKQLNNEDIKNEAKDLLNIFINEYEEKSNIILDYIKNRESKGIANLRYDTYKLTYERVKKLMEN